jgi:hypothetical protein
MLQCVFYLGLRAPARFATDSVVSLFIDQAATLSDLIHSESSEYCHLNKVPITGGVQTVRVVDEWVHHINGNEGISLLWNDSNGGGTHSGECRQSKGEATH